MPTIKLKNCKLVDGSTVDILINKGIIQKIGTSPKADQEIDIANKTVIPGVIDIHVHFREPGGTHKEDWLTGSQAAVTGGVTTVIDMPNTNPSATNNKILDEKRKLAEKSLVNYGFYLGATKDNFEDIKNARQVAGVKILVGSSTGNLLVSEDENIEKLFTIPNIHWALHAEDEHMIIENLKKYSNDNDPTVHSKIRDRKVAVNAVKRIIALAKKTNAHIRICHISTEEEIELIKNARQEDVNISCEVSPHHLFLNEQAYKKFGNFVKVNPPLRTKKDNKALMQALRSGIIDVIATDHAPHTIDEKRQEYDKAPAGIPEIQTSLPLLLNEISKGNLDLKKLVEITSEKPAELLHIKNKGKIKQGYDADLTVIDLNKREMILKKMLKSKCGWSPYESWELKGWPVMTFVNGNLVYNNGKINEQNKGKEITYGKI
jgi:dihydroorotase